MQSLLLLVLDVFSFILLARVILSWFPVSYGSPVRPVADSVQRLTEPVLAPIRSVLPAIAGLDLSPMIVLVLIQAVLKPLVRGIF